MICICSYHVGDLVNVTCYSRQSSPPASLAWKVNDNMVQIILGEIFFLNIFLDLWWERHVWSVKGLQSVSVSNRGWNIGAQSKIVLWFHALAFKVSCDQVAEPLYLFGTIRDWILTPDNTLNTAASNLQFRVQDHHRHTGMNKLSQSLKCYFLHGIITALAPSPSPSPKQST